MPWKELFIMDQRKEFVLKAFDPNVNFSRLCAEYCISTKTGYKWKQRFLMEGPKGLHDQPKRPHSSPKRASEGDVCEIVRIKTERPSWGARKIHRIFQNNHRGEYSSVSRSTVDRILKKAGLVVASRRRRKYSPKRLKNRFIPAAPNDLWTVDFKGWWYTPEKEKCEPLTVRDEYSKNILSFKILEKCDISSVKREFEELFKKHGLPKAIRSDNGPPFAHHATVLGLQFPHEAEPFNGVCYPSWFPSRGKASIRNHQPTRRKTPSVRNLLRRIPCLRAVEESDVSSDFQKISFFPELNIIRFRLGWIEYLSAFLVEFFYIPHKDHSFNGSVYFILGVTGALITFFCGIFKKLGNLSLKCSITCNIEFND
jgi:transposase